MSTDDKQANPIADENNSKTSEQRMLEDIQDNTSYIAKNLNYIANILTFYFAITILTILFWLAPYLLKAIKAFHDSIW